MFTATDLPEPVVPATSRWGMEARSLMYARPEMSLPIAKGIEDLLEANSFDFISSDRNTIARFLLGSSIPTTDLPGMGAMMRTLTADMARARSSDRFAILFIFTPGAGSNSKSVTTGPGCISRIFPLTPKSASFATSISPLSLSSSSESGLKSRTGSSSSFSGTVYFPFPRSTF